MLVESHYLRSPCHIFLTELIKDSNEHLSNSKEIENQGYVYSLANEAFKAIITDNVINDIINYYSLEEGEEEYIQKRLLETKEELNKTKEQVISKTNKMICDPENFEWGVAARQRITYAENRLDSVDMENMNAVEIFYKINTADEWLEIAKSFMKKNTHRSADTDCIGIFKKQAEDSVKEAENQILLERSMGYGEAAEDGQWYLDAAKNNLERGWYITSIYDATSAKVKARVGASYQDKDIFEIYSDFSGMEIVTEDLLGTIFLENSYYNIYIAIKENSRKEAILAMQNLVLSKETDGIYHDVKEKMGNPLFRRAIDWNINWDWEFNEENYLKVLLWIIILLVIYNFILSFRVRRLEKKLRIRKKRREPRI
jgi:predicted S18 family serine protease